MSLTRGAVLGDQPADRHARKCVEQGQHSLPNCAADVFESTVESFRTSRRELFGKSGARRSTAASKRNSSTTVRHFSGPPAMPTALAPAIFASCPTSEPTGPLRPRQRLSRPALACRSVETRISGEPRHAEHA